MEATKTMLGNLGNARKRDEYNSISTETRRQLIYKVFTLKMPISLAS